ncbi:MAG TPA: ATP-binding protein [Bauldia sp.]|nr:ATP-binding protein [Bauldia sp.]
MNGRTKAYLDLAALPQVGAQLLSPRPAFVFRADGSAVLWANAAGVAFFGAQSAAALLDRVFARDSALAVHLARLSKSLPADHDRVELLRFNLGVTQAVLVAACRRLDLGGGARAVLVLAPSEATRESLSTSAERLADVLAGTDSLAAVIDRDGRVLGASGGFDALEPAAAALDALILRAERADQPVVRETVTIGSVSRDAGVARVAAAGERLFLLIVGPGRPAAAVPETTHPSTEAVSVTEDRTAEPTMVSVSTATRDEASRVASGTRIAGNEPAPAEAETGGEGMTPPPLRFLWRTDAGGAFTLISGELAAVVGTANAPSHGESWRKLTARLGLGNRPVLTAALESLSSFNGLTVYWPIAGSGEAVAVDLAGLPEFARDRTFRGYRGFGVVRVEDRRRQESVPEAVSDSRPATPTAADAAPPHGDDLDRRAREHAEGVAVPGAENEPEAGELPADRPIEQPARSNVVHLSAPPTRIVPRRLSGSEEDAFRRIAEALGARVVESGAGEGDPASEARPRTTVDTAILDKLPVGIAVYRDSRTLYANRAFLDLLGYDDLDALVAAGGVGAVFADDRGRPKATAAEPGRLDVVRRDGTHVTVEAKLHAVPWSGATAMMLSLVRASGGPEPMDASATAPAPVPDEALTERVQELETILDTATDGVVIIDGDGRIAGVNRTAEALFGIEARDVIGTSFTDLLAEESRKAALDYIDGLAANGVASVLNDGREVIGKVPRGGLIPLFMTIGRLGQSGKYCAVLRDITHWKNVEEELTAARRAAEAANAQKSEFLAKISHEIRTPLNAIIGFSEVMMEERFGPIGSDRYRNYLRDIRLSGEHLLSLINDLLDLSKVEAGKLDLNFEAVSLNEVIRESVALMQPQANRDRIIIRTSLSSGLPSVVADLRSLRQILLNLLSNAIKFTRAGGQVIVATALEESGEVVVRVRDTGIGMTASDIDTAMKPFRQVAISGRPQEGTGLGLPLTKALVEANRATFSIDSVPNQGTLVRVTFPTTRVLAG